MSYSIEVHVAAMGSVTLPGRTLTIAEARDLGTRFNTWLAMVGGTSTYTNHQPDHASLEMMADVPAYNQSQTLALVRSLFTGTSFRGSILVNLDGAAPFFTCAVTATGVKWKQGEIPVPRTEGQEARP